MKGDAKGDAKGQHRDNTKSDAKGRLTDVDDARAAWKARSFSFPDYSNYPSPMLPSSVLHQECMFD